MARIDDLIAKEEDLANRLEILDGKMDAVVEELLRLRRDGNITEEQFTRLMTAAGRAEAATVGLEQDEASTEA